ncbi:Reducing polyketide synthase DEP5 [Metarhizium brunneum]|uniref:Reducing polyketide synthase DEP5 n=1 Tax=Metarhizium brunneum TaxID=500148 RepID=A0A7D5V2V0_9HYPO|nr:Reducing polyketide synthase DEP5 [Metarhizium brunneum]
MEDMTCGSVPVQVDEVSLWPPTKAQLQNPKANAYSWTEERGVRLTINETQLVGSDGRLLLSLEVTSASPVKSVGLADLVALAPWKSPGVRVLEFGALNSTAICQATELINYTATATSKPGLEALEDTIAGFDHATAINVDPSLELEAQGLKAGQFDLIIPGTLTGSSKLASLLAPGGRIVPDQYTLSSLGKDFSILNLSNGFAIATAVAEQKTSGINGVRTRSIAIIYRNKPTEIPCKLVKACNALGSSRLARLADASIATSEHVVVTCDLEGPLLLELEPNELAGLQNIVSNTSSVTWVTSGGLMKGATPEQAMASDVPRSVTSEMASLDFTTLDLDLGNPTTYCAINEIDKESEYCLADGLVYISRLVPDATLDQEYGPQNSIPKATPFKPSDELVATAKAVKVTFSHDEHDHRTVGANQIQVQVMLSGVNKEDVLVMEGADSLTTFSHEIYGAVVQKGVNVEDINVGDRVFGFSADRLATFQTVSASVVQKVEQGDVLEELVTLPLAYATAIHGLTTLARVEAGEIVLILHGTGDGGAATITTSKKTKAQTCVQ